MNKIRITLGLITFIGLIVLSLFTLNQLSQYYNRHSAIGPIDIFAIIVLLLAVLNTAISLFGGPLLSKSLELGLQNKILKKKIEQEDLKSRLSDIAKKHDQ